MTDHYFGRKSQSAAITKTGLTTEMDKTSRQHSLSLGDTDTKEPPLALTLLPHRVLTDSSGRIKHWPTRYTYAIAPPSVAPKKEPEYEKIRMTMRGVMEEIQSLTSSPRRRHDATMKTRRVVREVLLSDTEHTTPKPFTAVRRTQKTRDEELVSELSSLAPEDLVDRILAAYSQDNLSLDRLSESLDRRRRVESLARTISVWGLSLASVARAFGVSWQTLSSWLRQTVPSEHEETVADFAAATDVLVHYLKRDRIPAVVRRPVVALRGLSLTELLEEGDSRAVRAACRDMFRFDRVQG